MAQIKMTGRKEVFSEKSVLITGAGGLIGSALVDAFMEMDDYVTVYALGRNGEKLRQRFTHYSNRSDFHIVEGDVTQVVIPSDIQADFIVHAASPAHPLAYAKTPVDVMQANLLGTIRMLELARRWGARLLFVSSGEIYGISHDSNSAFTEIEQGYIDILNPRSCYPESKRAAETLCASYHQQYGVDTVVARLCHIYGAFITSDNSRMDAQFLRCAIESKDIVMKSPGTQVRSFCYVKDAVEALLYILAKGPGGEAYNIANKSSVASIHEYAETLAAAAGVGVVHDFPSEEEQRGYSLVTRAVLNASKLEALGWCPRYDLKSGITEMVKIAKSEKEVI